MILRNSDALLYGAKARFSDFSSNFSQQLFFLCTTVTIRVRLLPDWCGPHYATNNAPAAAIPVKYIRTPSRIRMDSYTFYIFAGCCNKNVKKIFRGRGGVLISLHFRIVKVAVLQSWDRGMGDIEPSTNIRTPVIPSQSAKFPHRC